MSLPNDLQSTRISRNWLVKMGIFFVALVGFGTWGLLDATVIYPRRGLEHASYKLRAYLKTMQNVNRLDSTSLKLDNPEEQLSKLAARESIQVRAKDLKSVKEPLSEIESARLEWLRSLSRAWKLDETEVPVCNALRTKKSATGGEVYQGLGGTIDAQKETHKLFYKIRDGVGVSVAPDGKREDQSPALVLTDLNTYWDVKKDPPSELTFYALHSQWVFVAVGYLGGIYIIVLLARAASKRYRFSPSENMLVLPGGATITPAELKEVDKRRWHKFFVTLVTNGGKSHTLDLLRYVPLEEWVLLMEKKAFPDAATTPDAGQGADAAATNGTAQNTGVPKDVGKISNMTYGGAADGSFAVMLFDPSKAGGESDYPAYVQGESLKALRAALSGDGGWQYWLTACCGPLGGAAARVGGGPSLGVRNIVDWLDGKTFGYQVDATRLDLAAVAQLRAKAAGGDAPAVTPYVLAIGRLPNGVAARLHETMMDPPVPGYLGLLVVKSNPSTIERISEPLELEAGLEIKGATSRGTWRASLAELEQAGLVPEDQPSV